MTLSLFKDTAFLSAIKSLLKELNVPVNYVADEPTTAKEILKDTYKDTSTFQLMDDVYFVGMIDDAAFEGNKSLEIDKIKSDYDGILIFGITLHQRENNLLPTRSQLAEISRAFNREFYYTPIVLVFKYGNDKIPYLAFANTERLPYKQAWREGEKVGRVSLLRDIDIQKPHRGHEDIINQLKIPVGGTPLSGTKVVDSFAKLYAYWQEVFSVSVLNRKFYQELSNWYFWAINHVTFPSRPTPELAHQKRAALEDLIKEHNATNVIRLLTRLLFTWFIKEKKLIPEELFDLDALQKNILNEISPYHEVGMFAEANKDSVYYKAILQNLFFASLNCPIEADSIDKRTRGFRRDGYGKGFGIDWLMRYKKYFKDPDAFLEMMNKTVPFLNGGLFECLDERGEGEKKEDRVWIDGFSDNLPKDQQLIVPNYLFFGVEEQVDLSNEYGVSNSGTKKAAVKGLINILKSYKFTITENTPIEEDVALDPELLGKVFENLLASYNPETKSTARKQTGSFYTPRKIVSYMVDESLIAYLKNAVSWEPEEKELDEKLHQLISYDPTNPFEENEQLTKNIVFALDQCKILDPACGSGAFPMGILQKMVHILQKLDSENKIWKTVQKEKAKREADAAFEIEDKKERGNRLKEIDEAFDQSINDPDYARKLFLIENCIYGVDIQPIAIQIAKLRFFISLVVDQKKNEDKPNFGIRALPNLETRFVTANTLISIEKPKDQLSFYDSPERKALETELKKVRHKLFSARTKDTKLKYRQKDEELRNAIAEELKRSGWQNDTAQKLADWDPYDQNASCTFFDPKWMFDVSEGFDVVIGNPPYKILTKSNTDKTLLNYFLKEYNAIKKSSSKNLYTLFIECAIGLLKSNSHLTFIVPEGLFQTRSYTGCVEIMDKFGSTIQIITFSDFVFENAVTGNLIFLYQLKTGLTSMKFHFDKDYNLEVKVKIERPEIEAIKKDTVPLKTISTSFKGMVVKDRNEVLSVEKNKDIFLLGKNISKWKVESCLYTDYNNLVIVGGTKRIEKHNQFPRILVRRTGDTLCCAFLTKPALTESTLYSIWSINTEYSNLYLFALLNSKLLDHYNKIQNITNQQGFPQILMTDLELLPIKYPENNVKPNLELLARCICFKQDIAIENTFNSLVFNLYFPDHMKERGIDVLEFVERDIAAVMQGRAFEKLTDAEKEAMIEQLHQRWSCPDNEVYKRIKLFPERSPEILKPILES